MALRETIHDTDIDLFRQELVNLINLRHPLVQRIVMAYERHEDEAAAQKAADELAASASKAAEASV